MIEIWAESGRFDKSKKLVDQARMILKKGCFFDLEILEICIHLSRAEYSQEEPPIRFETHNTQNHYRFQHNINFNTRKQGGVLVV